MQCNQCRSYMNVYSAPYYSTWSTKTTVRLLSLSPLNQRFEEGFHFLVLGILDECDQTRDNPSPSAPYSHILLRGTVVQL